MKHSVCGYFIRIKAEGLEELEEARNWFGNEGMLSELREGMPRKDE